MATVVLPVQKQSLSVRFYKEVFPDADDAVIATVTEIGEMGAYVKLLEFNNIPGTYTWAILKRVAFYPIIESRSRFLYKKSLFYFRVTWKWPSFQNTNSDTPAQTRLTIFPRK